MDYIIETSNLSKCFGKFTAVDNVSLRVKKGEIYGFLGLNGAGKTTTIRMLLGLIRPTAGTVRIGGEPIRPGGIGPWHRVGSLVEIPYAYPELTVRENLEIFRRLRNIDDCKSVDHIIDKLKLTRFSGKKAGHLSSGNAQRLGLAKALLHNPGILILDEPSNGLDPAGIVEIREFLIGLAVSQSVTIFVSSHILDEVARLATRIGIIHEGKLIKEMDISTLHSLRRKRLIIGTRDPKRAQELLIRSGYTVPFINDTHLELSDAQAIDHPEIVAELLVQAGIPLTLLQEKEDHLEDLFLSIIRNREGTHE